MASRNVRSDFNDRAEGSGMHRRTPDPRVTAKLPRVRLEELLEEQQAAESKMDVWNWGPEASTAKITPDSVRALLQPTAHSADDEPPTVRPPAPVVPFPAMQSISDVPPANEELAEILTAPPEARAAAPERQPKPAAVPPRYAVAAAWALTVTAFGGLAYAVIAHG